MNVEHVRLGLQDLREKAVEAHAFSDGARVNHLCAVAFDFLCRETPPIGFLDVRWVFVFSAYWTTNDLFLDRVTTRTEIGYLFERDKDSHVVKLFLFVLGVLNNLSLQDFPNLSDAVVSDKKVLEEDYALYEFAFELYWFFSQGSDEWKGTINNTITRLADKQDQLSKSLSRLRDRLDIQNSILNGDIDINLGLASEPSAWLAEGWLIYHSGDWIRMDAWVRESSSKIGTDHKDYSAFWSLVHFSRIQRWIISEIRDYDEQSVSLSRRFLSDDRQVESRVYESRRARAYADILKNSRSNTVDFSLVTRLLSLNAIAALRKWDYGNYRESITKLCTVSIDNGQVLLGQANQYWAIKTLFRLSRIVEPKKDPKLFEAIDQMTSDQCLELVERCVKCAPIQTDSAYQLLAYLSDLIVPEQHLAVVEWFFYRQAEGKSAGGAMKASWLDFITDILNHSPHATEIYSKFSKQILKLADSKNSLYSFGTLFSHFVQNAQLGDASKMIEKLIDLKNSLGNEQELWRILLDACKANPKLQSQCLEYLEEAKEDSQLLRLWMAHSQVGSEEFDKSEFKGWLRNLCCEHCIKVLGETDARSRQMYSGPNPQLYHDVRWSRTETKMRELLLEVIEHPKVFSCSKKGLIHLLAILANDGSLANAKRLISFSKRWLNDGVSFNQSPLDSGTTKFARNEVFYLISILLRKVKGTFASYVGNWILRQNWQLNDEPILEAYRLLISVFLLQATDPAVGAGVLALAESLVASGIVSEQNIRTSTAIYCFGFLLRTDEQNEDMLQKASKKQLQSLTALWQPKLLIESKNPRPEVRRRVAQTLVAWQAKSKKWKHLRFPKELATALNTLSKDRRMNVRKAASEKNNRHRVQ